MKAKIDTAAKTIAIEQAMPMGELVKFLQALFPDEWEQWKIETNVKIEWSSPPIIIDRYPSQPWGPYWYAPNPLYTHMGDVPLQTLTTYCLETQN